jgi:hypothetical protein
MCPDDYIKIIEHSNSIKTLIHLIIPSLVWTLIVWNYLLIDKQFIGAFGTLPIILFPYLINIYNWYTVIKTEGISMSPRWGYCISDNTPEHMKRNGVVALLDVDCANNNNSVVIEQGEIIADRFYYINYIILFVIIIVYNTINHVFKNKKVLKVIATAAGLSFFGSLSSMFSNSGMYSIIFQRFTTSFLNMNIAVVFFLLVYIFHRIYGM